MKIIVGLGNPGKKYLNTRHNLGFMVVDGLAEYLNMEFHQKKFQSYFCKKVLAQDTIIVIKPQTFMNLSGIAVKEAMSMYKCALQDLLVICDDLDLPLGKLRFRSSGGAGGHRGLKSIITYLGTSEFSRLKIGIGRPPAEESRSFVLSPFSQEEKIIVNEALENARKALETWIYDGVEECMNRFN